jgi:Concanavalin A-like lectin/glucanases superfamily
MGTKLTYLFSMVLILAAVGVTQADLVSQWTFEDGSGTQVSDVVGSNHGTTEGDPTWIAGIYGGAMEFHGTGSADGGGDRIDCGNDASLDIGSEVSLALWIRPDAEDPESGMETAPMCKALSGASPSWCFQVRYGWGGPEPYMAFTFNTSPRAWAFVGKNMEQGEWQHIACTHDGTTLTCYLNGEETDSTPMGAVTNSPAPVLIGSDGWGSDWIGGIDDVRYYSNFLTAEEIVDVMLDGAGPEVADDPVPENEAIDVSRDVTLG